MSDNRILVVEDNPDLLDMVNRYLRQWKFAADPFNDHLEALAHFKENPGSYSLVIIDIKMPQMNGIDIAGAMQRAKPDIKIILMTAYDVIPDDLESNLLIAKYKDILKKPFRLLEICNAVKKQMQTAS